VWLGCSDSRCPETTLLGLQPGDVFTHRNIANILSPTDLNFLSVLEYAVVHIKVKHIVLCGHTSCGGCVGALSDGRIGGVLDAWLTPLKAVRSANQKELSSIKDEQARIKRLAELNVKQGIDVLMANYVVREAIEKRGLDVHGVIFNIGTGKIQDLGFGTDGELVQGKDGSISLTNGEEGQGKHTSARVPEFQIVRGNYGTLKFNNDDTAELTVR
jgi:carbonic anhydrase